MANVLVEEESLGDIADAIRTQLDTEETYTPSEMADAIRSIEGGGGSMVNYSTEEQVIGTWIDGKKLYQKTWIFDNVLVINSTKWYTTNISSNNMKIAINAFGISESGKFSYPLMTSLEVNSNYISLEACRDADSVGCKTLTIQYTKSTD